MQRILMVVTLLFGLWGNGVLALAAELTVTADTAKIRAEASTASEAVGSTTKGKKYTSKGESKDTDGRTWYKIPVDGATDGYIRSDLVEVTGGNAGSEASSPSPTNPTPIAEQQATVSQRSVNVRSGASMSHSTVASLPKGTVITLIGEATDGQGNGWYQMKGMADGREVTGYVRRDMVTPGADAPNQSTGGDGSAEAAPAAPTEAEGTDGGEAAPPSDDTPPEDGSNEMPAEGENAGAAAGTDYTVVQKADDQGTLQYYLQDKISTPGSTLEWPITALIATANYAEGSENLKQKQLDNQKIIIIILSVVIVALVLVVSILLFKIRDLYEDYDEDEEEEEEEARYSGRRTPPVSDGRGVGRKQEETGDRTRQGGRQPAGQSRPPQQRQPQPSSRQREGERRRSPQTRNPEPRMAGRSERSERPQGRYPERAGGRPMPVRKPQNFLNDDDEFEFEFLNMDEKDI